MKNTTLCYIEKNDSYLMLYRNKKKNDENEGKYVGIGGHFLENETPTECIIREAKEETGLDISPIYRGIVTFVSDKYGTEIMHLFTCREYTGELSLCREGELSWVKKSELDKIPMWQGDRIFFDLLEKRQDFFTLRLEYVGEELVRYSIDQRQKMLVSACLLGTPCRYDGKSKPCKEVLSLAKRFDLVPVCPEVLGGLPTPRLPAEINGDLVIRIDGCDVTNEYNLGAQRALEIAKEQEITLAILKSNSPSCSNSKVYDGTYSGRLVGGKGKTADLLIKNGIFVLNEQELNKL